MGRTIVSSRLASSLLLCCLLIGVAAPAEARWDFGIRGGIYTDESDLFLGADWLTSLGAGRWSFNPNFEFVFIDNGNLATLSGDFLHRFDVDGSVDVWAGVGPTIVLRDPDRGDADSEAGLNLIGGAGFRTSGSLRPYVQGKIILADGSEAALVFGLRF